jgi:hypothetical protein
MINVRALADQVNRESISSCSQRPGFSNDLSDRESPVDVPAENCSNLAQGAALENRLRSRSDFLRGLQ